MLLDAAKSSLLLIDVQERLLPAMLGPEQILARCKILVAAATTLGLPVTISEQYPQGLGPTVQALTDNKALVFEKLSFSCWRDDALKARFVTLHEGGRPLVIVAGIEAHVCVLQTCFDLAHAGFGVFAVSDAMSSRSPLSVDLATERMRSSGVEVINTEMAVFELLGKAGTAQFKELSGLIK